MPLDPSMGPYHSELMNRERCPTERRSIRLPAPGWKELEARAKALQTGAAKRGGRHLPARPAGLPV